MSAAHDDTVEVIDLLHRLAEAVMAAGEIPAHRNLGVLWSPPSQLPQLVDVLGAPTVRTP